MPRGHVAPVQLDASTATLVNAGDLTATFTDGDLFGVTWRGTEVIQRAYVAVRDRSWNTIPALLDNVILVQEPDAFTIDFDAVHAFLDIDLAWHGRIHGSAEGALSYDFSGHARSDFEYCKIGLNLHHGIAPYAGRPYALRTADGLVHGSFSADIAPQLVRDGTLTAMTPCFDELDVSLGDVDVRFSFEGDLFEIQDHRNWSDANWKTYGTPLAFGFPMSIGQGDALGQRMSVTIRGDAIPVDLTAGGGWWWIGDAATGRLPHLGHQLTRIPSGDELMELGGLAPRHIRIDLHPDSTLAEKLGDGCRVAAALGCHLEIAGFLRQDSLSSDVAALVDAVARCAVPVDRLIVLAESTGFSEFRGAAPPELSDAVLTGLIERQVAVGSVVSGTPQFFSDINRDRPDYSRIDGLAFALNPQVHACDSASMMQNVQAIPHVVDYARRLYPEADVSLTPMDLIGANGPYPGGPSSPGSGAPNQDPRLVTAFGAAWTLAALSAMVRCGTTSSTLFELVGSRGVLSDSPSVTPVYRLLKGLAAVREWTLRDSPVHDPERLAALAFTRAGGCRAFVANLTDARMDVSLTHGPAGRPRDIVGVTSLTHPGDAAQPSGTPERLILHEYEVVLCEVAPAAPRSTAS